MSMLALARDALLGLFFPPHCAACRADTCAGVHLCPACAAKARRIEAPFCRVCSQPFAGDITDGFTCANCGDRRFHFTCAVAPYLSQGVVRDFIHRFKYEGEYHLRKPLAAWAAAALDDERLHTPPAEVFVPVPLHRTRQRERGFNQAEVIATLLARRAGLPVADALQRTRYTTTQTRLDRQERMENLRGAFRVRKTAAVLRRHIILVDDVFTTGSTVEECARVLMASGAASVRALTVARG
jgi:ComF family protein